MKKEEVAATEEKVIDLPKDAELVELPQEKAEEPSTFSRVAFPFMDNGYLDEMLLFFGRNGYRAWVETNMDNTGTSLRKLLFVEVIPQQAPAQG